MSAKVLQVIEVEENRGQGVIDDPYRRVRIYYAFDGTILAENDPCASERQAQIADGETRPVPWGKV